MTTDRQRSANAKNARKSTGPQTAAGKASTSKNAKTHGLTTPVGREEVLRWLRIILSDATATFEDLGNGDVAHANLALAEAMAQCARARDAEMQCVADIATYTRSWNEPDRLKLDTSDFEDPAVLRGMLRGWRSEPDVAKGIRLLLLESPNTLPRLRARLRVVQRYLRAAERRHDRAFATWIRVAGPICETKPKTS